MKARAAFLIASLVLVGCNRSTSDPYANSPYGSPNTNGQVYRNQVSFAYLSQNVLRPRCGGCHNLTYQTIMQNGLVQPGDPENSELYTITASGQMPQGGQPLGNNELAAIYYWIQAGAPSN